MEQENRNLHDQINILRKENSLARELKSMVETLRSQLQEQKEYSERMCLELRT